MSDVDRDITMADNFEQPKKGKNDMGEFEQHPLPDQIAMDKYLKSTGVGKTGKTKFLGTLMRKFSPPGSVG